MISFAHENLFEQGSTTKYFRIRVYNGSSLETVITDETLYQEEIEFNNPLCTENTIRYGACEAAYVKFKVVSSIGTLKGRKLEIHVSFDNFQSEEYQLKLGEYFVYSDELADDRKSREVTAYDMIYTIINTDVAKWYSELTYPISMKNFRDSFFEYFDIEQVDTTLCNDAMMILQTTLPDTLSGLDILQGVCGGNGCLGTITNEGKFKYVDLSSADTKSYGTHYKQGSLIYEDYVVQQVTGVKLLSVFNGKEIEVTVGTDDNLYIIEDNFLFYEKSEADVVAYVENIFNKIKLTPAFRPLKADTYGDFCVEVGDAISFTNSDGQTLTTFVLNKITKGIQALTDTYEIQGTEYFEYDLNDGNSQIRRLWNNTLALMSEAKTYVYAHRNVETFNIGHTIAKTIITIPVVTVDDTIPVFLATIPITMSADGTVTFRYFLDDVEINPLDTDTIYLTKGEQFVTLSTYFEMAANQNKRFTVTAQTGYRQSVDREQTAKILSLKDWIDNQSITVSGNTATFNYAYVEQPIDTTPPGATIAQQEIRAMIFASGLASEKPWDGTIVAAEKALDIILEELSVDNHVVDSASVGVQIPTVATGSDILVSWSIEEISVEGMVDSVSVVVHTDSYPMSTEEDEDLMTEEGERFYTEGD